MALRISGGSCQGLMFTIFLFLFPGVTVNALEGLKKDIFSTVNIDKQPAFHHPQLKDHKIQMEPSSSPKERKTPVSQSSRPFEVGIKGINCPFGTVPIKRTRKEDLIRAKMFTQSLMTNFRLQTIVRPDGFHYAIRILNSSPKGKYFGASGQLNLQNPTVSNIQFSSAFIRLQSGPQDKIDGIQVGWMVNPTLRGDNYTRSFTLWTGGNSGCFDIMCPGFVQINQNISLSSTFPKISVYGGDQYDFTYTVSQDPNSGNWWLKYEEQYIGYWPQSLFTHLSSSVTDIIWGGGAFSVGPSNEPSPPMGSGHYPEEGFRRAAYIRRLQIVDESHKLRFPDERLFQFFSDCPAYDVHSLSGSLGEGFGFLYGGPGGCGP